MIQKTKVFIPVYDENESNGIYSCNNSSLSYYYKEQEGYFFPLPTRTLASLTEEERLSIGIGFSKKIENAEYRGYSDMQYFPEEIVALLRLGIDIFGLIEARLAIEK